MRKEGTSRAGPTARNPRLEISRGREQRPFEQDAKIRGKGGAPTAMGLVGVKCHVLWKREGACVVC